MGRPRIRRNIVGRVVRKPREGELPAGGAAHAEEDGYGDEDGDDGEDDDGGAGGGRASGRGRGGGRGPNTRSTKRKASPQPAILLPPGKGKSNKRQVRSKVV
jgi:hypothetical protein